MWISGQFVPGHHLCHYDTSGHCDKIRSVGKDTFYTCLNKESRKKYIHCIVERSKERTILCSILRPWVTG
jgi:hypothetical protein